MDFMLMMGFAGDDNPASYGEPLGFQLEYAQRLGGFALPHPDINT